MGSKEYEGPIGGPAINPPDYEDYRQCDLCLQQHTKSTCEDKHCPLCTEQLDVCSECAEKLEWCLQILILAKKQNWNILSPAMRKLGAEVLFDLIGTIET